MTISRVENACKPLILQGLQKNIKIISTQGLTVLTTSAIVQLEQKEQDRETEMFGRPDLKGDMTYVDAEYFWRKFI